MISTLPPRAADPLAEELAGVLAQRAGGSSAQTAPVRPGVLLDVAYDPWPSRIAAAWQDAGGTVTIVNEWAYFTDPAPSTGPRFYRIVAN